MYFIDAFHFLFKIVYIGVITTGYVRKIFFENKYLGVFIYA